MELITVHSITMATDEAVKLWALSSSQYPANHLPMIQTVLISTVEAASHFALNARRALEILPKNSRFPLNAPRWNWKPTTQAEYVSDLWEATNRIIHAKRLFVGLEPLPAESSVIEGASVCIPYIQAETDRKDLAFIDPFAMAHAYLYGALPLLQGLAKSAGYDA